MSKKVYVKKIYGYPFTNMEVYFEYKNTLFYSTERLFVGYNGRESLEVREFVLVSSSLVEEYDPSSEASRYCRSEILIVQDIISFFVGVPLIEYEAVETETSYKKLFGQKRSVILKIDGKDYTNQLKILLQKMDKEQGLIITLLDRWRKAIYLTEESCDANLYHDEAILSYFHIIELCCYWQVLLEKFRQIILPRFFLFSLKD